ncbi:MAG: hypothetical protein ACOC0V_01660, partial [Oceanicaulis sp.]
VTPAGEILCDDDTIGFDAGVRIETPEAGRYAVFAGLLADADETAEVTLSVSEIGFGGVDRRLDVAGEPVFGVHDLAGGFLPDPAVFEVEAGGPADIETALGSQAYGCRGYATRTPSLRLRHDGAGPLHISMQSEADTTLAVNTPDGSWACDDDGLGDLDPLVSFETAQPGVYDIYAATYVQGETAPATLYMSGIGGGAAPTARALDGDLDAGVSLALTPGFPASAGRFTVEAGGPAELRESGEAYCPGYYSAAPSVELDWAGGPLSLATESDADTTLAVRLPDGGWACDDDGGEGVLSRIALDGAPGVYDIWVGVWSGGDADAVLVLEQPGGAPL